MGELTATRTEERDGYTLLYTDETQAAITNNGLDWLAVTPSSCSCPLFGKRGSCKHLALAFPEAKTTPEPRARAPRGLPEAARILERAQRSSRRRGRSNPTTLHALSNLFYALGEWLDPP